MVTSVFKSPLECIQAKNIPERLRRRISEIEQAVRQSSIGADEATIAEQVGAAFEKQLNQTEIARLKTVERQLAIRDQVTPTGMTGTARGRKEYARLKAVIEGDASRRNVDIVSFYDKQNFHSARFLSYIPDAIQQFTRTVFTKGPSRNKAVFLQVEREAFGESTGNPFAKGVSDAYNRMRLDYVNAMRAAGVPIHYDPNRQWIVHHDPLAIGKVDEAAWTSAVLEGIDLSKMTNEDTGVPFTVDQILPVLSDVYKDITTFGVSRIEPGVTRRAPFWTKFDESRFFIWKNHDAWAQYNAKFGYTDGYTAMVNDVHVMARNLALAEQFGPDVSGTRRFMTDLAAKAQVQAGTPQNRKYVDAIGNAFDLATGEANVPSSLRWAKNMATARDVMHSAMLGGTATMSMTLDNVTAAHARMLAGISAKMQIPQFIDHFVRMATKGPKSRLTRDLVMMGASLDAISRTMFDNFRGIGEFDGFRLGKYFQDITFRASGLTSSTNAIAGGFYGDFVRALTNGIGKKLDELPGNLAGTMRLYGIDDALWKRISDGAKYISVKPWAAGPEVPVLDLLGMVRGGYDKPDDVARVVSMIEHEKQTQAVISGQPEVRRLFRGANRPGSLAGEARIAAVDLSTWGVTYLVSKIFAGALTPYLSVPSRIAATSALVIGMGLLGSVVTQFRQITQGKTPYQWNDPQFWLQSFFISGGLGILGDLLFRENYGQSDQLLWNFLGPTYSTLSQALSIPVGVAQAALTGGSYNVGANTVKLLKSITPFSTIWFLRAAMQRWFFDTLQKIADPNAQQSFAGQRSTAAQRQQTFFWAPGQALP